MQAVKTLPTSIKEKRIPRAEAPCIPFTKRNKKERLVGIRRVNCSSSCLILVMRFERSVLKSAAGASKSVKTKLFKRLQRVRGVDDPAHTYQNGMEGSLS
eukprot:1160640-Pelagomonas_calceolata.AAC.2